MDESLVFDTSSHPSNISSVTNSTESNRPGPGRGLGIVYDVLGGKLERFVNEQGKKRGWKGETGRLYEDTFRVSSLVVLAIRGEGSGEYGRKPRPRPR